MSVGNELTALMWAECDVGDLDSAAIHMEEALQIRRQMVESDPDNNVLWQALADAMLAGYTLKYLQKDIEAAAALAASAYEITSKFVRLYPENESYALKHRIAGDSVEKCKRGLEKQ